MANQSPLIAVIILNWNGWQDTAACIRSLQKSTYQGFRILVVDNGSADGSPEKLRCLLPDLEILELGENLGFGRGNNAGIRHALDSWGAEFIWLLNSDTVVAPGTMAELEFVASRDPRIGALGARILEFGKDEQLQGWGGMRMGVWTGIHWPASPGRPPNFISGASMFLSRTCLEECGLFDPGYFFYMEDVDLCFRFTRKGWKIAVAGRAVVFHKGSASVGAQSYVQSYWYRRGQIRFLRTYAPMPWLPIVLTAAARLFLAALAGNRSVLHGTWKGFWDAVRQLNGKG